MHTCLHTHTSIQSFNGLFSTLFFFLSLSLSLPLETFSQSSQTVISSRIPPQFHAFAGRVSERPPQIAARQFDPIPTCWPFSLLRLPRRFLPPCFETNDCVNHTKIHCEPSFQIVQNYVSQFIHRACYCRCLGCWKQCDAIAV